MKLFLIILLIILLLMALIVAAWFYIELETYHDPPDGTKYFYPDEYDVENLDFDKTEKNLLLQKNLNEIDEL